MHGRRAIGLKIYSRAHVMSVKLLFKSYLQRDNKVKKKIYKKDKLRTV